MHIENDTAQTLLTTTELAVAIAPVPQNPASAIDPNQVPLIPAVINGVINVTAGTGATAVTVRVRAGLGTITGALIGNAETITLAAGASADIPFEAYDAVGQALGYTVTVQQTAATGNGTVNSVSVDLNQQ